MRRCLRGCCLPACTQGTTCVFSKKVEYLHNLVYQALETIFNKRSQAKAAAAGGGSGANKVCVCVWPWCCGSQCFCRNLRPDSSGAEQGGWVVDDTVLTRMCARGGPGGGSVCTLVQVLLPAARAQTSVLEHVSDAHACDFQQQPQPGQQAARSKVAARLSDLPPHDAHMCLLASPPPPVNS